MFLPGPAGRQTWPVRAGAGRPGDSPASCRIPYGKMAAKVEEPPWNRSTSASQISPGSGTTGWAGKITSPPIVSLPRRCWRSIRSPRRWPGRTGSSSAARSATWRPAASGSSSTSSAGLPTAVNTHDIARRVDPAARVAYVDHDPVVISHARNLLARSPGVIAIPGDMHEPARSSPMRRSRS